MPIDARPRAVSFPPALMIQGTGSHVGKSLIVAGLCRAFARRGLKVAPFKPQNMSNNAAVTEEGGEIGRAQALQARAAGLFPTRHMNPILLKPEADGMAQLVVQGSRERSVSAAEFHALKPKLLARAMDSYAELGAGRELVLVEGAGSPAEVNLRAGDLANMGFAEAADCPAILVADIERGGAIAAIVGTHALLDFAERMRIQGVIVNKFRGDPSLFAPALPVIEGRTGWRMLGVLPWFDGASKLPAEDSVELASRRAPGAGAIKIAILKLPRIANFDDVDPLATEADVALDFIEPGRAIPGDVDLVVIPGSKATIADLAALRAAGWDMDLTAHRRRGGRILGICAGYQMLGESIADPEGIEGPAQTVPGLALLAVATRMAGEKTLRAVAGTAMDEPVRGYEMHMGVTDGADAARPMVTLDRDPPAPALPLKGGGSSNLNTSSPLPLRERDRVRGDGAISRDGLTMGTNVHGLFAADGFRRKFLAALRPGRESNLVYETMVEETLDALAAHLEAHLDLDALLAIARGERVTPPIGSARSQGRR